MGPHDLFPEVKSSLLAALGRLIHREPLKRARDSGSDTVRSAIDRLRELAAEDPEARYALEEEIARGGMGVVYRVRDNDLQRPIAMKVALHAGDGAEIDPVLLARFFEEARVTGQLDHPGIVPLHEVGIDSRGNVYFTMRLVRGRHLGDVFELARDGQEGWNVERVAESLVKVCEAMAYAHSKGVVHRDLKPLNVMAGRFGEVYVMDWGVAKVQGRAQLKSTASGPLVTIVRTGSAEARKGVTIAGSVFGTPAYIAPEQARGEIERVDSRSDIYSLGAILYHLLAGHAPYVPDGAQISVATVLQWVIEGPPARLKGIAPNAPRDLIAICEKAMARDPEQRYQQMQALGDDLRAWLAGRTVSARPLSLGARSVRWCRRNPWIAALLLAVTLGGGIGLWRLQALSSELVRSAAIDDAASKARMLETVNGLYADAVVARVDRAHTEVTHDWRARDGAIPIPATFLTELASRISQESGGVVTKHYSDLPFRFRGPAQLDDFGRRALASLRADPSKPVESFETLDGRPVLRYAVARLMQPACVNCHNSHPDSPKTDWKAGDVRGVLEIVRPLDAAVARSRAGLETTLVVVTGLVLGLTALCAFALVRGARRERSGTGG